jgi:ABC-type phosphate transport system substrate-binding protein
MFGASRKGFRMKRNSFVKLGVASAAASAALCALASPAYAVVDCSTLTNPVYVNGSSASKPLLKAVAATLGAATPNVTIVYASSASCAGVDAIVNGTKATGTAVFWDQTMAGAETTCNLPTTGQTVDIGASDVYAATCNITPAAQNHEYFGPVQVMNFVVPAASTETSISAEAAYVALGFGGTQYQVAPWTDPAFMFIRPDTSGTKNMIGTAIGLAVSKWKGTVENKSGDVLTAVSASTNPNATLGILVSGDADANRSKVKILAFKAKGQSCGYTPDSNSLTALDKINVR